MNSAKNVFLAALFGSALFLIGAGHASAAVTVTGAAGGGSISADTAGNSSSPAWTTLGAVTLAEGLTNDFSPGTDVTLVLKTPAGFEFNPAVIPDITVAAGTDITSAAVAMTDASTMTITLTVSGTTSTDTLTLGTTTGIQVRPTAGSPLASGKHLYRPSTGGGTATITGITASADGSSGSNFGSLTEVVGAAAAVQVETAANGSGTIVPAQNVTAGSSITAYAVARDAFGNFVANVAADVGGWSLVNNGGGVAGGDLVPAGDRKSAAFTGHLVGSANLLATSGALTPTDSGLLTVIPAAANKLVIATQPSPTAVVGVPFAQQPVIYVEDAYNNICNASSTVTASRNGGTGTLLGTTSIAAVGGVATFTNLANSMVSTITITFFSGSLTLATSQSIAVGPGPFSQLQVLLPGETATPGVAPGKSGTPTAQTAGTAFSVKVNALDANWNPISTVTDMMGITSSDGTALLPANAALINGTNSFSVTLKATGSQTITANDLTDGTTTGTSSSVTVNAAPFSRLQVLLPGETAAPGTTTGKTGTPNPQTAGASYTVTVNAVDAIWNLISTNDTVAIASSDANATLPASAALAAGTRTFNLTNKTAGSWTVTASDTTHTGITASISASVTINAGAFTKLQLLMPGETAAPGTASGKTGAPVAQTTDNSLSVTVNAVDANWNRVSTAGDTVAITCTDPNAILPANAALSGGTQTFSVKFNTVGTRTVTATDTSDGSKTASTSPSVTVNAGTFAQLQILLPGQTAAAGTPAGQTGSPTARTAGAAFSVTVNAVDASYNVISTNDSVHLSSTDTNAALPANTAMAAGTVSLSVTLKTVGTWTITASNATHTGVAPDISSPVAVTAGALTKLQLLVPGETAAPGSASGKTGTPSAETAGSAFSVTVNAVDANWNLVSTNDTIKIYSSDANAGLPANAALSTGSQTFNVTLKTAPSATVTASNVTHSAITLNTSPSIPITAGAFAKLQLLLPGETAAPGTTTGKTGTPSAQTAGTAFNVTVNAVDANWNLVNTVTDTVSVDSTDANAAVPADTALVAGTKTLSVTFKTAGSATVTATDMTDGTKTANTSPSTTINVGAFAKLQLLMPGETAVPGSSTGKTNTPTAQTAGTAFTVTVNGVDANWNVVTTNSGSAYTMHLVSSDANATMPSNANLASGTSTFSVTLVTAGSATITASDVDDGTKTPSTSPSTTVSAGTFTKLQLLVPGETSAPGSTSGKTGTPSAQNTDTPFTVTVKAVDANWNLANSATDTVAITSSDANATLPANAALNGGSNTFSVKFNTAGSRTVTATDASNGAKTANTSPAITVNLGAFAKLQLLMPGETAAPGTTSGKTGSPTTQTAGTSFSVTVRAVDAAWNLISTNDTVHLASSDAQATVPANTALSSGSVSLNMTNKTAGIQTVTASDATHSGINSNTGAATAVNPGAASKLVIATQPSTTAVAGVAFAQQPVIWIEDAYNNARSNDTLVVTATRNAGAGTLMGTTNVTAVGGVASFTNLAHPLATNITINFTSGALTAATSTSIAVSGGSFSQLQVLLPGETAAPGTLSGKTGTPTAQTSGTAFTVRVNAVDLGFNLINTVTDSVSITSSDPTAILPADAALINGTISFSVTLRDAGSQTVTASDTTDGQTTGTSSAVTVNKGTFAKLQLLVPGETAAPGSTTGKTGTPTAQVAGTAFSVTVNSVDGNWNLISTNDTVKITSSDASATLPGNAALAAGTKSFSVTLKTVGGSTITASNVTHTGIAASTSSSISVDSVVAAAQGRPVVAIHDSELTRALETLPASVPTPSGPGTTGFQWWPTNWHYFVMPESVKEALRSDGTAYEVVGDADISTGRLLAANGQPRCPIVISLAAEAIRDDEIAQLTNYVAAGGTLLVGSSAFTRNADGTTRGDFALATQMGVHMVATNLQNWANNATFVKTSDHSLVSHIPGGVLNWHLPSAAEEVPWGISPTHALAGPHAIWQVQPSDAVVIARGDAYPYLAVKQYGKGSFIYCAAMQPLLGHGGYAPGMYAYGIFRQAIEMAFASSKVPVPKLSPWPYSYDAALNVRHDFEDYQDMINSIEASSQFETNNGVRGDYYFCTGTLRVEMTNSATVIASLRRAVSNYGATIGPHNGGLKNPNNSSLVVSNYDYWHWGPDEALDVTPAGYTSGSQYAATSISNAFHDVEGWLSGITNGVRTWVAPYFNATRDASCGIEAQLGVKTSGDQKLGPFPGWVLSTSLQTPGKRYPFISLPVSDWYVGSEVAQSMEAGHTLDTVQAAVDFYYKWGALINLYSHSSSAGGGPAGAQEQKYITYSMTKPRLWATNAVGVYSWWLARSNAQVIPSYSTNGNQSITTLSISGATDPRAAIELFLPQPSFSGLQVLTNGVAASGSSYRTNGQTVKLMVGTSVTTAEIRYTLTATAQNDLYNVAQGGTLTVPAPGVLGNDLAGLNGTLAAVLVSGPAYGALTLSSNGGFSYTPPTNFIGVDSFSYQASDGATTSGAAIVTICVTPVSELFFDDFARPTGADPLAPWRVALGGWSITNGMLQAPGALQSYSFAYVSNNWTDYWVQGRVQFPVGAFGGGLGGRVNPLSGAHYAAWIYPEGSSGGSSVLKLLKFQSWTSFGYNYSSYAPMQQVSLPGVGTNWHTVKLAFLGNQIAVYFDDDQVMSVTDVEAQPYLSGGISADMWTDGTAYSMSVDDVIASPLVVVDSYTVNENTILTVPAPGPLGNDTGVYSTNLAALLVTGPTNGTMILNSNGGFSYSPTTNFAGTDSFIYQANDGQTNLGAAAVTITVNPALIITADNQSRPYGGVNPELTGRIVGLQNGDNITASFSTAADANSPVGSYPITISLLDPDHKLGNYSMTTNSGALTVNAATLTVVAHDATRTYGTANPEFTGTITGIQNGDNITATYATTATAASPVSTYAITPTLVAPAGTLTNYTVSSTNGTLSVTAAGLTVVAHDATRTYGTANPGFTGTITGIQNGDNITATYATTATAASPVSTYAITPTLVAPAGTLTNYTVSSTNGTLSVTAAGLTVVAHDATRTYGTANPGFTGTITGIQNGDNITATYATTATAASPVSTYAITPTLVAPAGTLTNYTVSSTNGTLSVTAAGLTVVAHDATRTYGAANPEFTGTITGIQNGDNITATYATTATAASPVSTYPITPTLVAPAGTLTNYTVSSTNGTLSVTAAGLTVVAHDATRTYGTANPGFTGTITGIQNGDNITATYATTATAASPVSTYPITPTLVAPAGTLTNYTVSSTNGTLSVTAAGLTVVAHDATRTYGTANPEFTGTITGIQNGDNITATYATTATAASPVSTYAITPTLVAPAGTLTNYTVSSTNGTLSVTAAGLTVVAHDATRTYGTANPEFTGTITGIQNGDNITATYATTATAASPVSTYAITPTLVASAGTLTNYTVSSTNGTLSVTAAGLTVVAHDATRTYGTANPEFTGTITGIQNGDNITATYATTATAASPVSTYAITPTLVAPAGTLTNYTVSSTNGTLSVTAAGLTVVAHDATRTYGTANPGFTGTITGIQNGDNITATYATTATAASPVSTYAITPTLVAPAGTLTNYTVSSTNGTLSVTAAGLTVVAHDASRTYGTANPEFTGTITGIQNGDNITATYATTATAASPVSTYPITPTLVAPAGTLTNYTVSSTNGTLSVTTADLTVVAHDATRTYGAPNPEFTGTITGIQNGDNITATYATTATAASPVSTYAITPTLVAPAGTLTNYTVSSTNGTLSVTTADLTVVAHDATRTYGTANPEFTGTITGIQNGDNITATYATTATAASPVSTYAITPTLVAPAGTLTNYTVSSTNGTLSVTAAGLTVVAHDATRTYGTANPEFTGTITGIQNGDNITATYATTATAVSPVSTYAITPTLVAPAGTLTNYTVSSTNGTLSVTAAGLTVVAHDASRTYGTANPEFTGTITGIQNGDNITATYATTATAASPVSTYAITPTLVAPAGTLTNYTVSSTNGTLSVTAAGLTVVAHDATRTYGAPNPEFTGTITGIQNGDNITATYATTATAASPVSTYAITPTLVAPAGTLTNYTVSSTNGTLSVTTADLTVVAHDATRTYGTANPEFTGTITGIQNGDNITATYATTATAASPVSTYAITPTLVAPAGTLTNYTVSSTNGTLSVTAAGLTVVAHDATRTYGTANPEFTGTITGIQNGDNITATYATTATAASPVSTYAITPTLVAPAGTLTNYTVSSTNGTLSVTAAGLTVVAHDASRTYGTVNPEFTGTITGIQNGDNITATYATTATAASPVSTYAITPTLVAPAGTLTNYTVSSTNGTLSVTAADLTVVANNASRTYGTANPEFTGTITGIQNGDNITATYATTATAASPVSTYPITPTLVAPAGTLTNYTVSSTNGTLSVTAAGLTVVAHDATRTYGTANPGFTGTITGIQNGDNITATYATTATAASPVSTYPITPTLVAPAGTLTNYTVSSTNGTLSVTAAGLTVVAHDATRTYGTANPGFTGTITGIQNGDNITATYATTATAASPVSTYPITPTLVAPAGTLTNYTVSSTNGTLSVTAAGLTVVANNASRTYGAANPGFSGTITGIQNGDNITATYATTATAASPVSTYPITPTLVAPAGTLTNYTVSSTNGTLSVTAAGLTVVAHDATRTYGTANPGFSGTITGIQNGDNITATYATTATAASPVSTYPITPTLVAPAGTLTNYTVSSTNGTLSVTAAGLTVVAHDATRTYGTANPGFTGTITGIQNGDNITATYATTATAASPVSTYPITPTLVAPAGTLTNYTVSSTNGTLSVTAAGLTVVANNASRTYGAANPGFSGTITGIQNGDNITATYATTATAASPVSTYPITPTLVAPAGTLTNYTVSSTNGTLSVTAAGLTVVANNASRTYGTANPEFTGTITGIQNGDNITATYATTATAASPVSTYPITPTLVAPAGTLTNYTVSSTNGTLSVTAAGLTVVAHDATRTYGTANPGFSGTITGIQNGDNITATYATTATAASPVSTYPITPTLVAPAGTLTNYTVSSTNGTLSVTAAGLTVVAHDATRTYGTANPGFTGTITGIQNGDNITATYATTATAASPVSTYPITPTLVAPAGTLTNYTVSSTNGTLSVTAAGLTVVANNASRTYGAANPGFSGTITGIQNGDNITATYATTATAASPVSTYPITPTLVAPAGTLTNYTVSSTNGTLSVTAAGLTVVAHDATRTYGTANPGFSGTITGIQNGDNITATYATTATAASPVSTYPITPTLVAPAGTLTNYTVSSTNGTLSVTAAGLTVVAHDATRTYGTANPGFTGTITGIQNGDNITATYATTATAASPVSTYPITPTLVAPAGTLTNYTVSSTNGTLSVTAAGLTVVANNASRTYGAANPGFSGTITGIQNGDNITATYATTATAASPVSTYPITPTLVAPAGTLTNYTVSSTNGTLSVTAAGLTVVANNASRTYGTANPEFTGTITGIQNGDNITATYATTATAASPVSTYPITPTLVAPAGTLTNYTVSSTNGTLSVTAAGLTVVAHDATRTYGTANPGFSGTITGIQNGDNITATYATTATAASPVSTYPITPTLVAPAGTLTNYTVSSTNGTLSVTAAGLTVVAHDATRTYGTANPGFTGTITGIQNGDNITATYATTATAASPVSTYPITPTLVAPAGTLTNYTVSSTNGTLSVTAAGLTVVANNASRTYGAANPGFSGTITGIQNGDNITATYATTATAASPVSTYPITPTLVAPAGTLTNYTVSSTNGTLSVTAAGLTVVAHDATRTYGTANPGFTGTITGIQNGDNITATYATTATAASPVSTYAITPTLVAPAGTLTNYTVSSTNGTLSVTAADLTVVANNASRTYGTANPEFTGTITGIQNGDNITATYATTATAASPVSTYPITPTLVAPAGTLTNYTVSSTNGTLSVTAAGLTVVAHDATRTYGTANPGFTGTITGIQNGDNITATYATTATAASPVSTYAITPTLVAPAGTLTNYTVSSTNGTLSVTAAGLTVVAHDATRTYGTANPGFTGTITGIQNGDNITATYATTATAASPVSTYPITPTLVAPAGTLTNYTVSSTNGTLSVTAAGLTVVANNASRTYGAANPGFSGTITGIQNGDNITATYATTATAASPVSTYPITPTLVAPAGTLTNYTVSSTNGTLSVTAAGLTVVAHDATRTYGTANPGFSGTITGIQNGDNITATYATTATAASPVSTYPITPTLVAPAGTLTNYTVSSTNGTLSVTAAGLTVVAHDATRTYGTANPGFTGTITGIQNGDNITATYATTATAASPVSTYPITPTLVAPAGTLTNYTVSSTNGTLSVTAAGLTVVANNASRTYGAANPGFSGTITGIQNGDNITATYATTATAASPVSTYPITPTLVAPAGTLTNYTVSSTNGTLSVTAAGLTVVANNASRTYGTANPGFTGTITGIQNGDNITATYACTAAVTSPVGSYPITPTLVAPAGTLANYTVSSTNGTLSVTAAGLTVVAHDASRTYGAANPGWSCTITGIQNGDNITATYACTAAVTSPVGSYPITPTLVAPAGTLANYSVSSTNGTLRVNPAALAVTANNAARPYGMANPVFTGAISGLQNNDNITATYATAATQTSPAGTYPITPTLVDPSGKLANYTVTPHNGLLTVTTTTTPVILSIAPAGAGNVVITWTSISNSVYRVQYKANLASTNWISLTPDVIATGGTASFTDHPAGASQRYYRILFVSSEPPIAPVIQSIVGGGTPNVVITWSAMSNRVYRVQYKPNLASTSWLNLAPDVTAAGATASFTDHPGTAPQRFYRVVLLSTVTPLTPLAVTANNTSRGYGAANPVFSGTLTGVQNGDNITVTYATTATVGSPVGSYPISPTLVDPDGKLDHYFVSMTNGTLTVTAAPLVAAANNASRGYGATNPVFSGMLTGVQNGDGITATYACTATAASPVGSYPITPTVVDSAGKLANYSVTVTNGTLTVTAAPLTVTANNASRPYGAANPSFSGTIIGIQNGDNITATYATTATTTSPAGMYSIVPSLVDPSGKLANYTPTLNNGTLTITAITAPTILSIVPAAKTNLVITWTSVSNSVYRVQYKANLASTNWVSLTPDVTATGSTASFTDHPAGATQRYYRIMLVLTTPLTQPVIQSIVGAGTPNVVVGWSAISNRTYHVQYKTNLSSTAWSDLSPDITAAGSTASFTDHPAGARQRFYRVALLP